MGLRSKILILSSFLLILPWFGYQAIWEMEQFLRQGQEQNLQGTTRAVASALHERPALFNEKASFLTKVEKRKDLYVYPLKQNIQLNGHLYDWSEEFDKSLIYSQESVLFQADKNSDNPISFTHMIASRADYLYGYLQVTDKHPVFRKKNARSLRNNDHLIIALTSPQGELQQYIISVFQSGWFNGYKIADGESNQQLAREKQIQGYWRLTETGYNIEFRLPLSMIGSKLGFSLHNVSDENNPKVNNVIATSNTNDIKKLGTVLIPSPEIDRIIKGMGHTKSRIWVLDRHQRVIAKSGNIHLADGSWHDSQKNRADSSWLDPLYTFILPPPAHFIDNREDATQLNSDFIKQALQGGPLSARTLTEDNNAVILSAATTIKIGDKVMGIVLAEETTQGIHLLRNQAIKKLFNVLLTTLFVGILILFLFTANIASRIAKLRRQSDNAIDSQGRLVAPFIPSKSSDEIGGLSRGLADMVKRLGQYHFYLENLSSRLSHELKTPVAVVRSSLENLSLLAQNDENKKYIQRAEKGITRLNRILNSMSEASRIEESLSHCEKEILNVNEFLDSCVQGYQMTYSEHLFTLNRSEEALLINADPDFIVQLLDKLITNAMSFSQIKDAIKISIRQQQSMALITVSNKGPLLPEKMENELLNSMVSIRSKETTEQTHLGLGLFIANKISEFHHGNMQIKNSADNSGVEVELSFPLRND